MSESSTEEPEAEVTEQEADGKPEKLIPAKAVAKERSEKRAARDEANKLRGELAETSKRSFSTEELSELMDELAVTAKQVVEEQLKDIKSDRDRLQMAVEMGLNQEQATKVMEIRSQNPNLTPRQALTLARADVPDLFQSPRGNVNSAAPGGLPVGGASPARSSAMSEDFVKKMNEARDKGDVAGTKHFAAKELFARVHRLFGSSGPR